MDNEDTKNFLTMILSILIYVPSLFFIGIILVNISQFIMNIWLDGDLTYNFPDLSKFGKYELMLASSLIIIYSIIWVYNKYLNNYRHWALDILSFITILISYLVINLHFKKNMSQFGINNFELNMENKPQWLKDIFNKIVLNIALKYVGIMLIMSSIIYLFVYYYMSKTISSTLIMFYMALLFIYLMYNIKDSLPTISTDNKSKIMGLYSNISSIIYYLDINKISNDSTVQYLLIAILIIFMFIFIQYILSRLNKTTAPNIDKNQYVSNKIKGLDQTIDILRNELDKLYGYSNDISIPLPKEAWDIIIERNLAIIDNKDAENDFKLKKKLLNFLSIDNKYILSKNECHEEHNNYNITNNDCKTLQNEFIQYIRKTVPKIIKLNNTLNNTLDSKFIYHNKQVRGNLLNEGIVLQDKPIPLNKINIPSVDKLSYIDKDTHDFCISCWVEIHSFGPNTSSSYNKSISILKFGNQSILYNSKLNKLIIIINNGETLNQWNIKEDILKTYEYKNLPLQKFNNIVLNNINGTLDIFINGELVETMKDNTTLLSSNEISYGDNNGINGYIKNITYWPTHLTDRRIKFNYLTTIN